MAPIVYAESPGQFSGLWAQGDRHVFEDEEGVAVGDKAPARRLDVVDASEGLSGRGLARDGVDEVGQVRVDELRPGRRLAP